MIKRLICDEGIKVHTVRLADPISICVKLVFGLPSSS